jgi:hypothetical protein
MESTMSGLAFSISLSSIFPDGSLVFPSFFFIIPLTSQTYMGMMSQR